MHVHVCTCTCACVYARDIKNKARTLVKVKSTTFAFLSIPIGFIPSDENINKNDSDNVNKQVHTVFLKVSTGPLTTCLQYKYACLKHLE